MKAMVKVWALPDLRVQHHTVPPPDDTAHEWDGATSCGVATTLRWIPPETVDDGQTCSACMTVTGVNPPLEGDHPGPV